MNSRVMKTFTRAYHRRSQTFVPTLRENPAEATIASHQLLLRGGFIKQLDSTAGLYMTLPIGLRVLDKIERIVDLAMSKCGGNKLAMPLLLPSSLWKRTGRWETAGDELIRVKDRKDADYCLAPTHEEAFTELVGSAVASWRQLDQGGLRLYQTGQKYRDEVRPRFGLMRSREFIMKDMYSFDTDSTAAKIAYKEVSASYGALFHAIFGQEGVGWSRVEADTGNIGGSLSHEYQVHADVGEDLLLHCQNCKHSSNQEKMKSIQIEKGMEIGNTTHVWRGIEANGAVVHIHVGGIPQGRQVNSLKLQQVLHLREEPEEIERKKERKKERTTEIETETTDSTDSTDSADSADSANDSTPSVIHIKHGTDSINNNDLFTDLILVEEKDTCPSCASFPLNSLRGIEIGHVFYLGTKYSKAMNATYQNKNGRQELVDMGCYGIGISRIAAAAVERIGGHDSEGIIWPEAIAPYRVAILAIGGGGKKNKIANQFLNDRAIHLCQELNNQNVIHSDDIMYDDRIRESPGLKLKEASLIGFPWVIVLGKKSLPSKNGNEWEDEKILNKWLDDGNGTVEIQERATGESVHLPYNEIVEYLNNHPRCCDMETLLEDGFVSVSTA